ncbi:MAG: hypothetical protein GX623_05375 [Clostridiales bacterium]|nr:hypothetical protein [Clostridiales bacterium]
MVGMVSSFFRTLILKLFMCPDEQKAAGKSPYGLFAVIDKQHVTTVLASCIVESGECLPRKNILPVYLNSIVGGTPPAKPDSRILTKGRETCQVSQKSVNFL